jgi:MerR family mercuric resistance operon transcriptional regulator
VRRLVFIRRAKELGFSLKEIKELLLLRAKTSEKCESVRAKAQTKLQEVQKKINDLNVISRALTSLINSCQAEAVTSDCPILDALSKEFPS